MPGNSEIWNQGLPHEAGKLDCICRNGGNFNEIDTFSVPQLKHQKSSHQSYFPELWVSRFIGALEPITHREVNILVSLREYEKFPRELSRTRNERNKGKAAAGKIWCHKSGDLEYYSLKSWRLKSQERCHLNFVNCHSRYRAPRNTIGLHSPDKVRCKAPLLTQNSIHFLTDCLDVVCVMIALDKTVWNTSLFAKPSHCLSTLFHLERMIALAHFLPMTVPSTFDQMSPYLFW